MAAEESRDISGEVTRVSRGKDRRLHRAAMTEQVATQKDD